MLRFPALSEAINRADGGVVDERETVDFVVVGAAPGSKADKAAQLGVSILDEAAFLDLLSEHE